MTWAIEYYSKAVEHFIFEEISDGLLARYVHLSERMLEYGPNLKEPHTKSFGGGLFEMRLKKQGGGCPCYVLHGHRKADRNVARLHQKVPANAAERNGDGAKTHAGG